MAGYKGSKDGQAEVQEIDFTKPWDLSDITFIVEDQKVYANKMILSMSSPVMKTMFTANFKEKDAEEIELPETNLGTFLQLMKAVHPPTQLDELDLNNLLPLVDEYQMTHLKKSIEKYLLLQKPSLQRLALADTYGLTELREVCLKYAIKNSISTSSGDFTQLQPSTQVEVLLPKLTEAKDLISYIVNYCNGYSLHYHTCPEKTPSGCNHYLGERESCHSCLRFRIKTIRDKIEEKVKNFYFLK